jgi:DNA mismatch repair protein MutL
MKYQHFYLNGRPIRDKFIQHAVRESYRGLTEPGRYPAAILLLDMPPQDVDVNVHPTKAEVRFKDSGRIHGLVMSSLREKLQGSELSPRATPAIDDAQRLDMQSRLAAFFKAGPMGAKDEGGRMKDEAGSFHPSSFILHPSTSTPSHPNPLPEGEGTIAPASVKSSAIQLHNSYLVAESEDGLVIIDQHALHERIMFEELKSRITRGPLESQQLLMPQTFNASPKQIALLEQIQSLLARLGIEARPFGPDSVAVQAFPSFLEKLEPAEFVSELLDRGEAELLDLHEEELLHEILDMMACKAAVKAGDPLTPAEIAALLERRELVERSSNCPHGRPTTLRLSLNDLEKQFKRTGF